MGFLNNASSGYKKTKNTKGLTNEMLCEKLSQAGVSIGNPEMGTIPGLGKTQEVVLFHMGKYDIYVKADPKNITVAKIYGQDTNMAGNLTKELLVATVSDAEGIDTATADRAVEEIFDVVNQIAETGSGQSKVEAVADGSGEGLAFYMEQKIYTIRDEYIICTREKEPVYEVQGNFSGLSFDIRRADGEAVYTIKKKLIAITPEYVISKDGKKIGTLKKKIKITKPEISGEVDGQPVSIQGDMSGYHFSIDLGGKTVGSVDTVRLTWGDCYEIKCRVPEKKDLIVMIAIICDNSLKGKSE